MLASASQVRQAYLATLHNLFRSGAQSIVDVRAAKMSSVQTRCRRLAGSPRIFAAMDSGDAEVLSQVADDELREFFIDAKSGSVSDRASDGYLFLNAKGNVIEPGCGTPALDLAVSQHVLQKWSGEHGLVAQHISYLDFDGVPYAVLLTPVIDPDDHTVIGSLAMLFEFRPAPLRSIAGGGELQSGLLIGQTLYGWKLPEPEANSLATSIGDRSANQSNEQGTEVRLQIDGEPWVAYRRPLDPLDDSVQLVIAASLEPMHAAVRRLLLSGVAAGSLGLVVGLVAAVMIARNLAKPVALLGDAAQRIGSGDYSTRVEITRKDELGQLAIRFNEMTHGLTLRDKYRGLLDLVADPEIAEEMIGGSVDLGGVSLQVAVLFCDIRGFTPLVNRLSAHEVVELLNQHMTALTEVVYRHGGVVDKFVGDMIMAVFGAPKPGQDDALRAARCALDMVATRARMNQSAKEKIEVGIGVACGDVVGGCMGSIQRLNYTVLGERVNLAARLCSAAPAMCVYVDDQVHRHLGADSKATTLDPLMMKGFATPVQVYRLDSSEVPA